MALLFKYKPQVFLSSMPCSFRYDTSYFKTQGGFRVLTLINTNSECANQADWQESSVGGQYISVVIVCVMTWRDMSSFFFYCGRGLLSFGSFIFWSFMHVNVNKH